MAFIFHRKPISYSAKTLSTLLEKYKSYREEVEPTGDENSQYDELTSTVNLLSGGIKIIQQSRDALQTLINKMEKEFDELKLKGNRRELANEIEEIDNEARFNEKIAADNDTLYVLEARLTETRSKRHKIATKLGIDPQKSEINTATSSEFSSSKRDIDAENNADEAELSPNENQWLSEDLSASSILAREEVICRTLKPQQLKLPRFYGDEEEFPEFWAIFETSTFVVNAVLEAAKHSPEHQPSRNPPIDPLKLYYNSTWSSELIIVSRQWSLAMMSYV
ncbi:hypothetical protein Aduo_009795 [Ancylostoma duodenale]